MHKITSILFVTLLFFQSNTYAQFQKEVIHFESANPFSLSDIITDLDSQEKQQVFGQLTTPVDSLNPTKKYPLIIGVAGSMGWRKHHLDYLKMYQEQGYATFQLNSFKSRGITSTVGSQDEVTIAAVILDAYRALEELSKYPKINRDKVAITGWSLGGGVTLFAGWLPLKEAITDQVSFAAHLAFYPPCFINPENLSFTKAPIHILIGEADNWTPAKPCIDLVEKLSDKTNISITTYPDAHHGFDSEEPVVWNEKGYSFKDCLFDLTADGDVLMNYLRIPMSNSILQKVGFLFCVDKGVYVGGNLEARKKSLAFAKDFMNDKLLKLK